MNTSNTVNLKINCSGLKFDEIKGRDYLRIKSQMRFARFVELVYQERDSDNMSDIV